MAYNFANINKDTWLRWSLTHEHMLELVAVQGASTIE